MPRPKYTPDGDRIANHEHAYIQVAVELAPMPDIKRPIGGATVLWRCSRKGCHAVRESRYTFRRPASNQQPNALARPVALRMAD